MIKLLTKADMISLFNACLGFLAIVFLILNEQRLSLSFILLALLADGLDGIVARKFGGGKMGESLEAMADMVSLSVAPLLFTLWYAINLSFENYTFLLLSLFLGFIFLLSSAIRLASFHVLKDNHFFVGLPASVSTLILVGFSYVSLPIYCYFLIILFLSIAMISPIKFPKPSVLLNIAATILIILTIGFYTIFNNISMILLVVAMLIYSIAGPIYLIKIADT
jgi:phosphatidylserine synthase